MKVQERLCLKIAGPENLEGSVLNQNATTMTTLMVMVVTMIMMRYDAIPVENDF